MGGFAERLAWSPAIADFYQVQPWQMGDLTPGEVAAMDDDISDAAKRRGLGTGG
jgi:hypothetical protein